MEVNCGSCNAVLLREPNRIKKNKSHYCDRKCLSNAPKARTNVDCSSCGKKLERFNRDIKQNKTQKFFCGFDCRSEFYKRDYQVVCVVCGIDFEKVPAEQKRHPVHCCSVECRSKYNDRREHHKCDQCGSDIFRPPSVMKDNKNAFCSVKCYDVFQNQKTLFKCNKCNKDVWVSPSGMHRRHHFCSIKCFSTFYFSESFVESEFEKLVKILGVKYDRNNREVLKGMGKKGCSLELDFYFPDIKFAVEINGACHYKPVYGEERLAEQKRRDRIKRKKCKELGIILRTIKPGNCKVGTYLPRYKRVVWEIKQCQ